MKPRFAVCLDNSAYPVSLELHQIYREQPDDDGERDRDIRIVDESGEDYLYPAKNFALIYLPDKTERILMDFSPVMCRSRSKTSPTKKEKERRKREVVMTPSHPYGSSPQGMKTHAFFRDGTFRHLEGKANLFLGFA